MVLKASPSSTKAFFWQAMDFTDPNDPQIEKLTARFKTEEIANKFKQEFENSQVKNKPIDK